MFHANTNENPEKQKNFCITNLTAENQTTRKEVLLNRKTFCIMWLTVQENIAILNFYIAKIVV